MLTFRWYQNLTTVDATRRTVRGRPRQSDRDVGLPVLTSQWAIDSQMRRRSLRTSQTVRAQPCCVEGKVRVALRCAFTANSWRQYYVQLPHCT